MLKLNNGGQKPLDRLGIILHVKKQGSRSEVGVITAQFYSTLLSFSTPIKWDISITG
jgi:hypothetical protein